LAPSPFPAAPTIKINSAPKWRWQRIKGKSGRMKFRIVFASSFLN